MNKYPPRFAVRARTICQSALSVLLAAGAWLAVVESVRAGDAPINPYPRAVIDRSTVALADFSQGASADHWRARMDCTSRIADGRLIVAATGGDPIVGFLPIGARGWPDENPEQCGT